MFDYHGVELEPVNHLYNQTYLNERAVEVAVARWWLAQLPTDLLAEGLEVGNVLGHYDFRQHDVIDLHEPAAWYQELGGQRVLNIDVFDLTDLNRQARRWPWIVSLSTLEHIGEAPPWGQRDAVTALRLLGQRLDTDGRLLVSWPTGVNPYLDDLIGSAAFTSAATFTRDDAGEWAATSELEVRPYGDVNAWASAVFIGEIDAR